ncbi:MAG: hypothetical protein IJC07_05875 [Clostridia bacterium]|nr:hypothetical protein [Clostridia bacterium]
MSSIKKIAIATFAIFAFLFIATGYAAVSRNLSLSGMANIQSEPKGVIITNVEVVSWQGVADAGTTFVLPTNVNTRVNANQSGNITYRITFENNTDRTYWFRQLTFLDDLDGYRNDLIGANGGIDIVTKDKLADANATFNTEDWIPPHTVREIYAIYNYGNNVRGNGVATLVNFKFGERVQSYADGFLAILNTPEKYQPFSQAYNEMYANNGTTIIGNVGADQAFFDRFFGQNLTLDGKPVTIMIERRNVDGKATGDSYSPSGPTGCEYTIYITTEDDTTGTPTVYAVSYTQEEDGTWVQIGELYEGKTSIGTYTDSEGDKYTSFNVDSWEAVKKTYTVYTYKGKTATYMVNNQYGNSFQQQKTIEEIMSVVDVELYNQLDKPQILVDIYKILFVEHVGSTAPEIMLLREAYDNAMRYYQMRNNGQEFGLSQSVTRAEVLSTIEALAHAMEYYTQVHDTNHK